MFYGISLSRKTTTRSSCYAQGVLKVLVEVFQFYLNLQANQLWSSEIISQKNELRFEGLHYPTRCGPGHSRVTFLRKHHAGSHSPGIDTYYLCWFKLCWVSACDSSLGMDAASIPGASHRSHEYVDQERRVSSGRFRQLNVRIDGNISDEAFSMQGLSWVAMNKTSRDRYLRISNLLTPAISEVCGMDVMQHTTVNSCFKVTEQTGNSS